MGGIDLRYGQVEVLTLAPNDHFALHGGVQLEHGGKRVADEACGAREAQAQRKAAESNLKVFALLFFFCLRTWSSTIGGRILFYSS